MKIIINLKYYITLLYIRLKLQKEIIVSNPTRGLVPDPGHKYLAQWTAQHTNAKKPIFY